MEFLKTSSLNRLNFSRWLISWHCEVHIINGYEQWNGFLEAEKTSAKLYIEHGYTTVTKTSKTVEKQIFKELKRGVHFH